MARRAIRSPVFTFLPAGLDAERFICTVRAESASQSAAHAKPDSEKYLLLCGVASEDVDRGDRV